MKPEKTRQMSQSTIYNTSVSHWGARNATEVIVLNDLANVTLARIPHRFVQTGGDSCTRNSYLFVVLHALIRKPSSANVEICYDGRAISPAEILIPGIYVAQVRVGQDISEAPGPHAKTTTYKPFSETETDTASNSSRSSCGGQSAFRAKLFQRDQKCLVTGTFNPQRLIACHIVPFSLGPEFVAQISDGVCNLYSPANGITLRSDLHTLFDEYSLGIYYSSGEYIVHCFSGDRSLRTHHGQSIKFSSTVHQQAPDWLPDIQCLAWHYEQCVLTRFRGYHVAFPHYTDR